MAKKYQYEVGKSYEEPEADYVTVASMPARIRLTYLDTIRRQIADTVRWI